MRSKRLRPRRMIAAGFLIIILLGTVLLMMPVASADKTGISFVDSLFTSTSAVCVTGLVCVDPGVEFSLFGQIVLAVLIQIGGLGITSIGVIIILAAGGRFSMRSQRLIKEALNLSSGKGIKGVVQAVLYVTVAFELVGAACSFFSFSHDYSFAGAVRVSIFHSIAAFNNAGFDVLGNGNSLVNYQDDTWLCAVTSALIIFGGLGFFVITEMVSGKPPKRWSLQTKAVTTTTIGLIIAGMLLLRISEGSGFSWLDAFFQSVSARTAGFASVPVGSMSTAGLLVLMVLMFIGASPGSTGGGIKTTTFFVLMRKAHSIVSNRHCEAFGRTIPASTVTKAFMVFTMAASVIVGMVFVVCMLEPDLTFQQIAFEVVSAYGTTGLSTGITPDLSAASKVLLSLTMYTGRLGALTLATVWMSREVPACRYSEEDMMIG